MHRFTITTVAMCLGAAAISPSASAHDFWIAPSAYSAKPGERIDINLRLGHIDHAEDVARSPQRIKEFSLLAPDGTRSDIAGQDGKSPAGVLRAASVGWHIVVYRSNNAASTLEAEKFESYLREEGLEQIIEQRKTRGESTSAGVETYSRCAKSLICITDAQKSPAGRESADRAVGLRLELIAHKNPSSLKPGDEMPIVLLFDGKPVEGVQVVAMNAAHPHGAAQARSDKDGRVSLKLPEAGMWLIHAVHMTRLPEEADADWESLWASLTFEVPQAK